MAFSINDLATELGIDPSTLAAKGDVVAKWNGYLSSADTKYQEATQAQKDAVAKLEQAQREQAAIDAEILKFGTTETRMAELETAVAIRDAALAKVKASGFNVDLSGFPTPKVETVDPVKELRDRQDSGFRQMGQAMKVAARYSAIYEKPFVDDPVALVSEAIANRMDVEAWAEKKFDFAGEQKRRSDANLAKQKAEWEAAAVNKYKEDNPVRSPLDQRGVASKHPQIFKPRDAASAKTFANLPAKERLAQSVARGRALAAESVA